MRIERDRQQRRAATEAERNRTFDSSRPGLTDSSPEPAAEAEDEDYQTPEAVSLEEHHGEQPPIRLHCRRLFDQPVGGVQGDISFWEVSPGSGQHPLSPRSVDDSLEDLPVVDENESDDLEDEEVDENVMAVQIPAAEDSLRLQIDDDMAQFKANMDKNPPNLRQAAINNNFVESELKKLQVTTYGRLTRLDAAAKAEHKQDWIDWKTKIVDRSAWRTL